MTSASFATIELDSIIIQRDTRQRRELRNLEELAGSIKEVGLINPPVVTRAGVLVAGERRTEACRMLGWTSIPVQYAEDLDELTLQLIELEENVKRVDLTWQEHNDAIAAYHKMQAERNPEWSNTDTGRALGLANSSVSRHLLVNTARIEGAMPDIEKADKFSTALGLASRAKERRMNTIAREVELPPTITGFGGAPVPSKPKAPARNAEVRHEDFLAWAETFDGEQFNLIHCDFPYGITTGDKKGQSAAKRLGSYDDGEHVYWRLVEALLEHGDSFIAPKAHLIFWFSMKFYSRTVEALTAGGWKVDPFPFIWLKSDNAGIIPDRDRGGRRVYETALLASRGDRLIVRPVANAFSGPTTKEFHTSEKSNAMLSHLFRMYVDGSTRLLDPTCGSGMAVKAAEAAGAEYALGLERDEEFARAARRNCKLEE